MTLDEDAAALQAENALRAYGYKARASTVRRKTARMSCAWPMRGRPTRTIRALPCAIVCCAITGSSCSSAGHRQQDSDHCGYGLNQRGSDRDVTAASPGIPGVETLWPVVYTVLVANGGMPLETAVDLVAGHPAAIFGPALHKGSLVPGGDANVVLYDPTPRAPLDERTLHSRAGCSLWHGVALQGRVIRTISRGVTVYRDGTVTGTPSHGRVVLCAPFDRERVEQALRATGRGV